MLKVYTYANCSTCRNAVKWLRSKGFAFDERPIRDTPPVLAELRTMLAAQGNNVKRLFNTSGGDYRALQVGSRLESMSSSEALDLLAKNGNLVKRPFLLGSNVALVGFDETAWSDALGKSN